MSDKDIEEYHNIGMNTLNLKDYANENGLPIMDRIQFDRWTEELGKEQFRVLLSQYIAEHRPKFPLKNISHEDMRKNIIDLSKFDTSKICTPKEQIEKKPPSPPSIIAESRQQYAKFQEEFDQADPNKNKSNTGQGRYGTDTMQAGETT